MIYVSHVYPLQPWWWLSETMPTTTFWLLHTGFALGSGLCFVLFKFIVAHHLEADTR